MHRRLCGAIIAATLVLAAVACDGETGGDRPAAYPIRPTDELVAQGGPIYQAQCSHCHGDATTQPPHPHAPPHTAEGHTWHHADRLLVQWILDGVPLATHMPKFRGHLSEGEVRAVVAYIKTFWPEDIRQNQIEGSALYEAQLAER